MSETIEQISLEREQIGAVARMVFKALLEILESDGSESVLPKELYRNGVDAILVAGKHPALRK